MTHSINSLQGGLWKKISIIFAVVVIFYGVMRIVPILEGVKITTNDLINHNDNTVTIQGVAKHAKNLSVNGRPILIDPEGNFVDEIMLNPGINKITLIAEDIRGKIHTKEIVMSGNELKELKPVALFNNQEIINN